MKVYSPWVVVCVLLSTFTLMLLCSWKINYVATSDEGIIQVADQLHHRVREFDRNLTCHVPDIVAKLLLWEYGLPEGVEKELNPLAEKLQAYSVMHSEILRSWANGTKVNVT